MSRIIRAASLVSASCLALALLAACPSAPPPRLDAPKGFAPIEAKGLGRSVVMSPEGVRIEAYRVPNEPEQSLAFWTEAYLHRMKASGYAPYADPASLEGSSGPMAYCTWILPYEGEDYVYGHAFAVVGKDILIVELAGPRVLYESYKDSILESIKSARLP